MSWLSQAFGSDEIDAQNRARDAAQNQAEFWMENYQNTMGQTKSYLSDLFGSTQKQIETIQSALPEQLQEARLQGRQMSAQTGLIGGGQEKSLLDPILQNITNLTGNQIAGLRSGYNTTKLNAILGLNQMREQGLQSSFGSQLKAQGMYDSSGGPLSGVLDFFSGIFSDSGSKK